jgi:hypothetical protein
MLRRVTSPAEDPLRMDLRTKLFVVLAASFTTCLLVGEIIGGKLVELPLPGWTAVMTVGMIPFPVTFLLTDLLNEFYGKKAARFVTFIGFGCAVLTFAFIAIGGVIPIAGFTRASDWSGVTEEAFQNVFLGSQRMIVASLIAYVVAQLIDIFAFQALKRLTRGRLLWLRSTGSTVISQAVDTITINFVAWSGILGFEQILNVILSSYALKVLIAVSLTPLVYAGHAALERGFGIHPVPVGELAPEPAVAPERAG